jgi:hypothetical protein
MAGMDKSNLDGFSAFKMAGILEHVDILRV